MKLNDAIDTVFIMGPTASGKSALALNLAEQYNAEIVSADSMQLYRGLDIGTAKPTIHEQQIVPHHLIDVLDISEKSDVFRFVEMAQSAIDSIHKRGKIAIVAGGTGFYLKSLLRGLDNLPGDAVLRSKLEVEFAGENGFVELKKLMQTFDAKAFLKYQSCQRKLLRSLEVKKLTGQSIVDLQQLNQNQLKYTNFQSFRIEHPVEVLKQRINCRARIMLKSGWIDEARIMLKRGLLQTPSAWQAIGYAQIDEFLQNKLNLEGLIDKISTCTWQFARRQNTWFRHQHPEAAVLHPEV